MPIQETVASTKQNTATITHNIGMQLQRQCACGHHTAAGGECETCRKKRQGELQRAAINSAPVTEAPAIVHEVLHSSGQPLDAATRSYMEPRFGHDFSRVRVHTGAQAAQSARAVNALAYTVGHDIVLNNDRAATPGLSDQFILAHELAHVVQQGEQSSGNSLGVASAHDPAEAEANSAARAVLSQGQPQSLGHADRRLQRLGANPSCTTAQAGDIHQAIYDANSWANKALTALSASPLEARTLSALRHNFGASGTAANAPTIAANLRAGRADMLRIPYTCATAASDTFCASGNCGDTAVGGHASNICADVTLATNDAVFRAGCVLHEAMHASDASMTGDEYSGWFGHSSSTAGYPGSSPLANADSYTALAMELS